MLYHVIPQNLHSLYQDESKRYLFFYLFIYLFFFDKYILNFLLFCILSFFRVNGPKALYINPNCLTTFSIYNYINKEPINEILLIAAIKPFASHSSINLNFLLWRTAHFDRSIIHPLFVFITFGFYFLDFFYTSNNKKNCFLNTL